MSTKNYCDHAKMMKIIRFVLISVFFLSATVSQSEAFNYNWQIDEIPEGQESVNVVEPVEIILLEQQPIEVSNHSTALRLKQKYSVYLDAEWDATQAYKLWRTFESIPQNWNYDRSTGVILDKSLWKISRNYIQDDINIAIHGDYKVVTVGIDAFTYADPLLAQIEGVKGRIFSKRLHNAVVRFVTDSGTNKQAVRRILHERYGVSIDIPDYVELTKHTTREHSGRFTQFKNEELMGLISMLEEFPEGMIKTPGLKYLVRRLDGLPHPLYPETPAVAWTYAGYIEFMEGAFKGGSPDYIHRLILHEKAHFLWVHLFDEQLKQDWIELGGWYENPDDPDGWSTTQQTEFVSAYAHAKNPDEDMAESISFYVVRPDKLRSRAPAKYEFIQNRIMHGTRYISQIREDLTFEVYNLYPDYVYPGRIIRVDIQVEGAPEEDKKITVEAEIHGENNFDTATGIHLRVLSEKGTYFDIRLLPIDSNGHHIPAGHVFRGYTNVSRYAANGYWMPDGATLSDAPGNQRHQSAQTDFGWKLYINNPFADCDPPEYVPNSIRLSLSQGDENGRAYQIVTAQWELIEENGVNWVYTVMNDDNPETYASAWGYGLYDPLTRQASVKLIVPDYYQTGRYEINSISMRDIAGNFRNAFFTHPGHGLNNSVDRVLDETPVSIDLQTKNPDSTPPTLDLNQITIQAEPTNPDTPNGETRVEITFKIKDNISGYKESSIRLRDPLGSIHAFRHSDDDIWKVYFTRDPTIYHTYKKTILLPVGSVPGIWGLAEMVILDKAGNRLQADFTEIVRFKVDDAVVYSQSDVNEDGEINILDLVLVAQAFGTQNPNADVNGDGAVNILDLVEVASQLGEEAAAAPSVHSPTADQIQGWLSEAMQANDGSNNFRRGIQVLQSLLLKLRDTKGRVVRTLALGHQTAGYYTDRNRAAYWDGRNGLGESVASGVYFYQLKTDATSYLRKMVILK